MKVITFAAIALIGLANCHVIGDVSQLTRRQQSDAVATPDFPALRPLPWGQINFIHTTDTHGWLEGHVLEGSYNGDLGDFYSFTVRMKEKARQLKKDLFIVDTGDTHDGNGLSDVTSPPGQVSQPLVAEIPYDILTIGNHELYVNEITQDVYDNFAPVWNGRYLTSNVYIKDVASNKTVPIGSKYTFFEGEFGTRVLAFGFLYNFTGNGNVSVIETVQYEVAQPWFTDALKQNKPTVVVLLGHIALTYEEFYVAIKAVRNVYPNIPIAVLGGHTHIRTARKYDALAAGIESGRYLETIGFFSIDDITDTSATFARRYLDQNRKTYIFHSTPTTTASKKGRGQYAAKKFTFDTDKGQAMTNKITQLRQQLNLSQSLGCAPQNYYLDSVDYTNSSSIIQLVTQEVMPKILASNNTSNPQFFLTNSGGIRYDIYKGPFTLDNMYQISPFEDHFFSISDVPYDIVSQILPSLNKAGENMKKRGVWPYNVLEARKDESQVTFGSDITPGYVTHDDFGSDGDDTVHSPLPYFNLPAFIASPLSPPSSSSSLVDIVYVDFIDAQLQTLLYSLSQTNFTVNQQYTNLTSSTMWIEFAKQYWPNCA